MKFDRFSEIFQRRQRLWVAALGLALALGVAGAGASAYAQTSAASITTQVHLADHTPAPCAAQDCLGQVAPNKSVVHDLATVTSADPRMTPTGSVAFAFYTGTAECNLVRPATLITVPLNGSGGTATAESASFGPLDAGDYSFRAIYQPDAAAKALGFRTTPGNCEQLLIIKVEASTLIHFQDGLPVPCVALGCTGQVAPAGSVVHDVAIISSGNGGPGRTPTGTVTFAFFVGHLHCGGRPASVEVAVAAGTNGIAYAESSNTAPLAPGAYSYKAIYTPDAAAIALGLGPASANCEQLEVLDNQGPVPTR